MSSDRDTPAADGEEQPMNDTHDSHDTHETAANTDPRAQARDTGGYERAPKDFEADVDATTVKVPDHPVFVYPKIKGEIKKCSAYLVTQGELEDRVREAQSTGDDRESRKQRAETEDSDVAELGAQATVDLLNDKYVSPSFDLSVEDYINSPAGYYQEYANQLIPEVGN